MVDLERRKKLAYHLTNHARYADFYLYCRYLGSGDYSGL